MIEATVSDILVPVSSKPFVNMMTTAAIGLHAIFQEMSAVHYIIGFVMTNGGCTHKVRMLILKSY